MSKTVDNLLAIGRVLAPMILPGAGPAIAAGEALLELVSDAWPTLTGDNQAELAEGLKPLLAKMNRNVDDTIARLGGTGR